MSKINTRNTVTINVNYLKTIIANTGKNDVEFSEWIGYCRSYICSVKKSRAMRVSTAKSICAMCDADYNQLVLPEKVEQPEEPKPLYADDKTLSGIVETLMRIEKKLDDLHRMYCEGD